MDGDLADMIEAAEDVWDEALNRWAKDREQLPSDAVAKLHLALIRYRRRAVDNQPA